VKYIAGAWHYVPEAASQSGVYTLDATGADDPAAEAVELLREAVWRPFCLDVEGPFRLISVKIGAADYFVGFVIFHGIGDGYSLQVCSDELARSYDSFAHTQESPPQNLPLQYLDYRMSVQEWLNGSRAKEILCDWAKYIEGVPKLNASHGRAPQSAAFVFPHKSSDALRELSQIERIGLTRLWETIYHIALWRLLGQTDVATFGAHNLRQRHPELANTIGHVLNLLPSRTRLNGETTFRQLLRQKRDIKFKSLEYRVIPYSLILERCALTYSELLVFNFLPTEMVPQLPAGTEVAPNVDYMIESSRARFLVAPPPGVISASTRSPSPIALIVVDHREFAVQCGGTMQMPFSPVELLRDTKYIAEQVAADPECSLASLLAPANDRGGEELTQGNHGVLATAR
jgi:hypothetical protein